MFAWINITKNKQGRSTTSIIFIAPFLGSYMFLAIIGRNWEDIHISQTQIAKSSICPFLADPTLALGAPLAAPGRYMATSA